MSILSPSKAKLISTLLIMAAMWTAHKVEDWVGDPLLARFAPLTSAAIERGREIVEHVYKTDESDVFRAGVVLYGVEIAVKVVVSYVFASIIVHFFIDHRLKASNKTSEVVRQ